ncbi:CYFA0S15e00760g1_1 [Cyberlindnera fabianii]|uniref:CYFA0S15e00760g1_1 n=1 Tax=Cyberlindnera fabianii TaxID=36022 RepID=A0A061B578_CYBFA|nr:CYFA0S15e00760g1_1 [Cyberlindnera fabianii]
MPTDTIQYDKEHIWHPYTSLTKPLPCYEVVSASGSSLTLSDGRQLIDGMSSWWCAIHGYNNQELNLAATEQISKMSHVMFGGITHKPAVELVEKLLSMTDDKLDCCFLADSGSVSVEVALKMAIQHAHALGKPEKTKFLTIEKGYHGDTFGAMSVCDPVNSMHSLYAGYMSTNIFARAPQTGFHEEWDEDDIADFKDKMENNHNEIAAVILEPILQGAGGMRMYHPTYLVRVRQLCDKFGIPLIFDEIATGFGRTGKLFAYEHAGVVPDIITVGKALTGGYVTLAAVICQRHIADTIGSDKQTGGSMMHGPTFMGNPLACAIASKSMDILMTSEWKTQVPRLESQLKRLGKLTGLSVVRDIRVLGAVGVVELNKPVDMTWFQKQFVERGVWIRPFGKLVYIMPPYVITTEELDTLIDALMEVVTLFDSQQ